MGLLVINLAARDVRWPGSENLSGEPTLVLAPIPCFPGVDSGI
jgi:hypothetical protein